MRELGPRGADARRFGVGVVVTGGVRRGVFGVWRSFGGAINSFQLSLDTDPVNYNNNHNKHNNTAPRRRLVHDRGSFACRCRLIKACLIGKRLSASKPRDNQDTSKQRPHQRHLSCCPQQTYISTRPSASCPYRSILQTPGKPPQLSKMAGHGRGMSATFIPGGPSDDYYQPAPLELIAPEPQR